MPRDSNAPPPAPPVRPPALPPERSGAGYAAIIGAAVLIAAPITASQEGYVARPAPDPVGISTVCFGERVDGAAIDAGRVYSRDECMARLRRRLAIEYAPKVLACLPELRDPARKYLFAALIDAAWNAGPGAVCASPMAARIHAGQWNAACAGFTDWYRMKNGVLVHGWHVAPKGVPLGGLVKRRFDVEAPLCRAGAAPTSSAGGK